MAPRWKLPLAALLLLPLALLQRSGLERSEEVREESRYSREEIPVKSAAPAYLSSLFLGPFRALVADLFWVDLTRLRKEQRFYEAREVMEMLSWLQPRNPEVWAMLGWDAAYNIPEGDIQDEKQKWSWIRYGFLKFHEGISHTPTTPHLKFELGYRLLTKVTWSARGGYDEALIRRFEEDDEIQRTLRKVEVLDERHSPFLLAAPFLISAREDLFRLSKDGSFPYQYTPLGLALLPDSMDGFLHRCYFYEAYHQLGRGRVDLAERWLREAARCAREMRGRYGKNSSELHDLLARFYENSIPVLREADAYRRIPADAPDRREKAFALLRSLETLLGPIESVTEPEYFTDYLLSPLKRDLSGIGQDAQDEFEFNDNPGYAIRSEGRLVQGRPLSASLAPLLTDRDYYVLLLPAPEEEDPAKPLPTYTFTLKLASRAEFPIRCTVRYANLPPLLSRTLAPHEGTEISFSGEKPGFYSLLIEAAEPADRLSPSARYDLEWTGTSPPFPSRRR